MSCRFKVAALLDSDAAGDQAAQQETLLHTLGNKCILRAVAVAAGVVGPLIGTAATAAQDMTTQRRAAALLERPT